MQMHLSITHIIIPPPPSSPGSGSGDAAPATEPGSPGSLSDLCGLPRLPAPAPGLHNTHSHPDTQNTDFAGSCNNMIKSSKICTINLNKIDFCFSLYERLIMEYVEIED